MEYLPSICGRKMKKKVRCISSFYAGSGKVSLQLNGFVARQLNHLPVD